jgi:hypothetical protein
MTLLLKAPHWTPPQIEFYSADGRGRFTDKNGRVSKYTNRKKLITTVEDTAPIK